MSIKSELKKVLSIGLATSGILVGAAESKVNLWSRTFQAEKCKLDSAQLEIVGQKGFRQNKGVALKKTAVDRSDFGNEGGKADLTFTVNIPKDGHYVLTSVACVDDAGAKLMKKAKTEYESLWVKLQIPGIRTTRRVAYEPWRLPKIFTNELGIFQIAAGKQTIKIDIPRGLRLDQITICDYVPPEIPQGAENYKLPFSVPKRHPRLLMNPAELARIRLQIMHPDNTEVWAKVRNVATAAYNFDVDMSREVGYNGELLRIIRQKALYSLISGNESVGREAVELTKKYITCVEYGNLLDISRENGETIFTASIVYDWCYNLLTAEDKELFYKELMRLALIMECGYPPFKQQITTGHGSEAMMNRDMLSMAVAFYEKDPKILQYLSYQIFERLIPLRDFEYRSPRHSQGIMYATFRFRWEMYNAFIFKRMLGREVFGDGMRKMGYMWMHMRTPGGEYFRSGDGVWWDFKSMPAIIMLMCSSYAGDDVLKAAYRTTDSSKIDPFEYILFSDTALDGNSDKLDLPQGFDYGPVYPSLSVRTSWQMGDKSQAAAAEVRGGGFQSGNHQHCAAGSFQLYYRGQIICPLDQYGFAGTPYYHNFAMRSVARSMMLVYDPAEKFLDGRVGNDGGSRFIDIAPGDLAMLTKGELLDKSLAPRLPKDTMKRLNAGDFFYYGTKRASTFLPDAQKPVFSIFSADLKGAYSDKVKNLVRTFAFIDLGIKDQPALAVVYDQLVKRSAELDAYWQVTTLVKPQKKGKDVILTSFRKDDLPRGKMLLQMVKPAVKKSGWEIMTGKKAHNVFGKTYLPPDLTTPSSKGSRVVFKYPEKSANNEFLAIMNMYAEEGKPAPVKVKETADCFVITVADRALVLVKGLTPRTPEIRFALPEGKVWQTAVFNLEPGKWQIRNAAAVEVQAGKLTAAWSCKGGEVVLTKTPQGK